MAGDPAHEHLELMPHSEDLQRLVWTNCAMIGEGIRASGVGQGITIESLLAEEFRVSANGVDYVVVVTDIASPPDMTGIKWTVMDVGSFDGRHLLGG